MDERLVCVLCLVLLCAVIIGYLETEHFGSKKEKASAIYDYFMSTEKKSYADFRDKMEGKTNIVDYELANSLADKPNFFEKMEKSL